MSYWHHPRYVSDGVVNLSVRTMKGRSVEFQALHSDTIGVVKDIICSKIPGIHRDSMRLLYRGKYIIDENDTLREVGVKGSSAEFTVVYRVDGGSRGRRKTAQAEVAWQLRHMLRQSESGQRISGVISAGPDEDDMMVWHVAIEGPQRTPYHGFVLQLQLTFPGNYPHAPPGIKFMHPIFHPNVYETGNVCWEDRDNTGNKYDAEVVVGMVNAILEEPNCNSPANSEAAMLFTSDHTEYRRQAREMCEGNCCVTYK